MKLKMKLNMKNKLNNIVKKMKEKREQKKIEKEIKKITEKYCREFSKEFGDLNSLSIEEVEHPIIPDTNNHFTPIFEIGYLTDDEELGISNGLNIC